MDKLVNDIICNHIDRAIESCENDGPGLAIYTMIEDNYNEYKYYYAEQGGVVWDSIMKECNGMIDDIIDQYHHPYNMFICVQKEMPFTSSKPLSRFMIVHKKSVEV